MSAFLLGGTIGSALATVVSLLTGMNATPSALITVFVAACWIGLSVSRALP